MYFGSLDLASDTERLGHGSVRSHIIVDHCDIGRGTASGVEPGCTMEASVPIVAAGCKGAPTFPAR